MLPGPLQPWCEKHFAVHAEVRIKKTFGEKQWFLENFYGLWKRQDEKKIDPAIVAREIKAACRDGDEKDFSIPKEY